MKSFKGKVKRTYTNYVWDTEIEMYRVEYESPTKFEVSGFINDTELKDHWSFVSKDATALMEMTTDEIEISDIKASIYERNTVPKWKRR